MSTIESPLRAKGSVAVDAAKLLPPALREDFPILEQTVHGDRPLVFLDNAASTQRPRQVIEVQSRQFAWVVSPREVPAGTPLAFRITSDDVSHGFGLYDPDDKLVFQVQAVPGELQKEFATLTKPGRYRVICLEFCGVGHHVMLGQLTVTG